MAAATWMTTGAGEAAKRASVGMSSRSAEDLDEPGGAGQDRDRGERDQAGRHPPAGAPGHSAPAAVRSGASTAVGWAVVSVRVVSQSE